MPAAGSVIEADVIDIPIDELKRDPVLGKDGHEVFRRLFGAAALLKVDDVFGRLRHRTPRNRSKIARSHASCLGLSSNLSPICRATRPRLPTNSCSRWLSAPARWAQNRIIDATSAP